MKPQNILLLIVLTSISGFLSVYKFPAQVYSGLGANVIIAQPGIIFGIMTGIYFLIVRKVSFIKFLLWVLFSGIAYFVAVFSSIATIILGPLLYAASGIVGAAILAVSVRKNIYRIYSLRPIIIAGGLAGFIFGHFFGNAINRPESVGIDYHYPKSAFFGYLIWQIVVAVTIDFIISKSKEKENLNTQTSTPTTDMHMNKTDKKLLLFIAISLIVLYFIVMALLNSSNIS